MAMANRTDQMLNMASLVIGAVAILTLIAAYGSSFWCVRRKKDAVRRPFWWLKLSMPFYLISLILRMTKRAQVVTQLSNTEPIMDGKILFHINVVFGLFGNISIFLLMICFVDLGISFHRHTQLQQQQQSAHKIIYNITCTIAGLLSIVSLAAFTSLAIIYNQEFKSDGSPGADLLIEFGLEVPNKIQAVLVIIFWIVNIPRFCWTMFVLVNCKCKAEFSNDHILFVKSDVLFLLRNTFSFAFGVKKSLGSNWLTPLPIYTYVLMAIFDVVATVVVFVLLCIIGSRRNNGLWSDPQQAFTDHSQCQYMYQSTQRAELGHTTRRIPELWAPNAQEMPQELWSTQAQKTHQELSAGEAHVYEVEDTSVAIDPSSPAAGEVD